MNEDLHFQNVLAGTREPWLVIDPKPLAGDLEWGVIPLFWNRFTESTLDERFALIVASQRAGRREGARLDARTRRAELDLVLEESAESDDPALSSTRWREIARPWAASR